MALSLSLSSAHIGSPPSRAIVFEDPRSLELLRQIRLIAPSEASVLVTGETGTGKEIVSRYVHELSRRSSGPMVCLNCGALPDGLADAELFGFERGAFTGASSTKAGWFEAAQGGTLFLDEIVDLPLRHQVKLLRVLQEREVVRLGSRHSRPVDVRVIAATNSDLAAAVGAGRFREDLYFRLSVATLAVPPLRERPGDILPLTEHFLRVYGQRAEMERVSLTDDAVQALLEYAWPGNVRELANLIHRAVVVCENGTIDLEGVFPSTAAQRPLGHPQDRQREASFQKLASTLQDLFQRGFPDLFEQIHASVILGAYRFCHDNQVEAARLLGVTRNVIRGRLAHLGLIPRRKPPRARAGASK